MESVGDARSFFSAAREVALTKPIIVLKVGRTTPGAKAVMSHTGAPAGSDEVFDAAFRRAGVLRVNTLDELFGMAEVLGKQPRPLGSRLAIVTNGGGPGALAADALIEHNGSLANLSDQTIETLDGFLRPFWSTADQRPIIAVARLIKDHGANEAELAIVISDDWQGKGLGTKLLCELLEIGRTEGLERIGGRILPENYVMQHICRKRGLTLQYDPLEDAIEATIELRRHG
jgi:acyl-CoA synthetase (NDP forming)